MRTLTSSLLAAQKQATATPFVRVAAVNKIAGVVRHDWSRLYYGEEDDYYHAAASAGDGSLIRARVTPPGDSGKVYRQRVTEPGEGSDFSQWAYTGQYDAAVIAAAALGAEAVIVWIKNNREVRYSKSNDYGATWGSPALIDYTPTTYINGLAVAYKPGGDLAVFFVDMATVYVKKRIGGQWQSKVAWDKSTGELSGIACVYGDDWDLLVTGADAAGNSIVSSLVYGDGGEAAAGAWTELKVVERAPAGGDFSFCRPFLDRADVYRCFFTEKYAGTETYSRPFWSHSVPGAGFAENLWREPVPFNLSSEYGVAMTHDADYCWLSTPGGVWKAGMTVQTLDVTADVIRVRLEQEESAGSVLVELRNDDGRYAAPGQGELAALDIGCRVDIGPGYITDSGSEYSDGPAFCIEALEHRSSGGRSSLVIRARDGWNALDEWRAGYQFRWNKDAADTGVKAILAHVLARAGLNLDVKSESAAITGFCPDFTISPGMDGGAVIRKLLSFVPDVVLLEGTTAYIVNPLPSDNAVYAYGTDHYLQTGEYRKSAMQTNRVKLEGFDSGSEEPILVDAFSWGDIDKLYDRTCQVEDANMATVASVQQRGEAYLREAEMKAFDGVIAVSVNCGQQLYDVVDITDPRAGLNVEKQRVLGLVLEYHPQRGLYSQRLRLGAAQREEQREQR